MVRAARQWPDHGCGSRKDAGRSLGNYQSGDQGVRLFRRRFMAATSSRRPQLICFAAAVRPNSGRREKFITLRNFEPNADELGFVER